MPAFGQKSKPSPSTPSAFSSRKGEDFFGVQAKLNIGKSNDKYEVEADNVADQIVSQKQNKNLSESFFNPSPLIQKKTNEPQKKEEKESTIQEKPLSESITPVQLKTEKEEAIQNKTEIPVSENKKTVEKAPVTKPLIQQKKTEDEVQTKEGEEEIQSKENDKELQTSAAADANPTDNSNLENNLNRSKGGGSSLPGPVKKEMESGFGADFNNVKIHNDSNAVQMNKELGSQAFANGSDIYFNEGKYNPNSTDGKHLLAHELTHTVQQGASAIQPKMIQKTATPPATAAAPGRNESISLQTPTFTPTEAISAQIEAAGNRGADVDVTFGQWASGTIKIKKNTDDTYSTKDSRQSIALGISYLSPLTSINITPVLAVQIENSNITGYITVKAGDRLVGNPAGLINAIKDNSQAFGWVGIDVSSVPNIQNNIDGGNLTLTANGIPVQLGGFVNGSLDFGIQGENITFRASGTIEVPNMSPTQITIERNAEGNITGEIDIAVNMANFNGSLHAAFLNGTLDIRGTVGYQTEKISGQVTLLVTDAATARNAALSQLDPSQIDESARETNGIPEANTGPTPGPRAMAGWGEVDFSFTEWMTGKAMVIIDNEGHVTIHGEITPPAEVELFAQRDYIREIFTVEVRTMYGVPLVGNVFLFANIGLEALAKIGPAKIYNIRAVGTYSTDPAVFNDFSLSASFNMSMFAGLRLRAEGGLGVELLGHDVKVGVGVNALAGIRGYVDATPTIGYRETASPEAGRQGEFYIHGHAEMAAQPFLALGGDLFVELDSPWWSPAPDDKWTWPLGELEYPLPGEFGIGADVDYVLGSDQLPEVEFAPVDFNSDKFMTDLMNDHVPPAQAPNAEHPAEFQEGTTGGAGSETPQVTDSTGNPNAGETGTPPGATPPPNPPTPEVLRQWGTGLEALRALATESEQHPLNEEQVNARLHIIKTHNHFTRLTAARSGQNWNINAEMPNINNHSTPITVKAAPVTETGGTDPNADVPTIIGLQHAVNVDGGHNLKIEGTVERVEINVYSDKQTLNQLLNNKRQEIHDQRDTDSQYGAKSTAIENLFREKNVLGTNIGSYKRAVDNAYSVGHGNEPVRLAYESIRTNLTNIAADLAIIGVLEHRIELPVSNVEFETDTKGRSYMLRAAPLTKIPGNTRGSTPTNDPSGWSTIPVTLRSSGQWVRAHLLNHRLHGPGTAQNLFPGTRDMNLRDMENQVEHFAKEAVWDNNEIIYYNVDVSYGNTGAFENIPDIVVMSFGPYNPETREKGAATKSKRFTQTPPSAVTQITINGSSSNSLNEKAISEGGSDGTGLSGFFDRLVRVRPSGGYQNIIEVRNAVSAAYTDQTAFMSAFTKFNNLVTSNILQYD
ncbi:eCIS core domain-containing protein [Flavobacterium sp. CF136]|uniref:eCIS core domain-containing protein n=1 Tax=Flavobacterium sp. (strain CF136) TaxID=1144313 RepID=UPI000271853D|nr:DUF4157 domain-containing protein [Flavobacterium sp. CF136]EJL64883.1 hypothetical protein PMI10_01642 [Flavobacterium sp. CF136]